MAPGLRKLAALQPGDVVAIINCVAPARVIERVAPNRYRVEWNSRVFVTSRSHLTPWHLAVRS
jgi:hypothetical protein